MVLAHEYVAGEDHTWLFYTTKQTKTHQQNSPTSEQFVELHNIIKVVKKMRTEC